MTSKRKRRMAKERLNDAEGREELAEVAGKEASLGGDVLRRSEEAIEDPTETVIESEIDALRAELADLNNKWMRALADLDNYKKRVERDRCRWADAAREDIVLDLLDVVDNFERALACDAAGPSEAGSFREGVELILKQLVDVLRRHGITPIRTEGCEFDPSIHEAVGHVESDRCGPNEIVEETQRGYMLGDRPLRCSKVVVAK
jgi:molecular chaperone GrpE